MRIRSDWLTFFTMTGLALGALFFPRGEPTPSPVAKRTDMTAAGVDYMPVGTARPDHAIPRPRTAKTRP